MVEKHVKLKLSFYLLNIFLICLDKIRVLYQYLKETFIGTKLMTLQRQKYI